MSSNSSHSSSASRADQSEQPKSFKDYVIEMEATRWHPVEDVESQTRKESANEESSDECLDDDDYEDEDSEGFECEDEEEDESEEEILASSFAGMPWFEREKEPNVKNEQSIWIEQDEKTYKANLARVERLRELAREKIDMVMRINNRFKSLDEVVLENQAVMQQSNLLQQTTRGMSAIADAASAQVFSMGPGMNPNHTPPQWNAAYAPGINPMPVPFPAYRGPGAAVPAPMPTAGNSHIVPQSWTPPGAPPTYQPPAGSASIPKVHGPGSGSLASTPTGGNVYFTQTNGSVGGSTYQPPGATATNMKIRGQGAAPTHSAGNVDLTHQTASGDRPAFHPTLHLFPAPTLRVHGTGTGVPTPMQVQVHPGAPYMYLPPNTHVTIGMPPAMPKPSGNGNSKPQVAPSQHALHQPFGHLPGSYQPNRQTNNSQMKPL